MTGFGDYEPEDAWDPADPPAVLVSNLRRRLGLLFTDESGSDLDTELDVIVAALSIARRRMLTDRDLLRADDIEDDAAYVRTRLP